METLNKLIALMARPFDQLTAHLELNQPVTVRPEPVKGLFQRFLNHFNTPSPAARPLAKQVESR